jgi:UDPglucose 6-dehydrogenase
MKLTVIGAGYVGLVTAACFSEMGNEVVCVDNNGARIDSLNRGEVPIHEPGLESLVKNNLAEGRLRFTQRLTEAVEDTLVYFIAVGTPQGEDGSADLSHVLEVAKELGRTIRYRCIVANKSTVPVGTATKVKTTIQAELNRRGQKFDFEVVSNPEFLKEGDAVNDFMRPDRVIIGAESPWVIETLRELYAPFTRSHERILVMRPREAEMTKYAANAMLATRISFMNELAALCERLEVDVERVRIGIGADHRIGYAFIYPGCGYGGSCFPKDVRALIRIGEQVGIEPAILKAVDRRNEIQKKLLFEKVVARFGTDLSNLTFAVWGLAFKPGTDDMREAPSRVLIEHLVRNGAKVQAYDPAAMPAAQTAFPKEWLSLGLIKFVSHQYDALANADALLLVTEWKPFRHPDFRRMKQLLRKPVIFDGRNQYDPDDLRAQGIEYYGIGRPC